jgi:hypothetical protein
MSPGIASTMLCRLLTVVGAALSLVACAPTSVPTPATATPAPLTLPLAEVPQRLETLWTQVQKAQDLVWSPQYSPYFPTAWPPGGDPLWGRYAFAYGRDPRLADAVRVSGIWARVDARPVAGTAMVVSLLSKAEAIGTQGVFPLPGAAREVFAKQDAVLAYAFSLRSLPDAAAPATTDLRAFYREWGRGNGVILAQFKANHAAFFAWLES